MIKLAIVDDKYQNRHSLAEKIVYSNEVEIVFTAVNGKDFLDKMKTSSGKSRPEVVLMDIEMPEMDGKLFLKKVHLCRLVLPVKLYS